MLLELFPFIILNNAMAFVYAYFFSDFLCFDMSLLLLTVTLWDVSNKHCLLYPPQTVFVGGYTVYTLSDCPTDRPSVCP